MGKRSNGIKEVRLIKISNDNLDVLTSIIKDKNNNQMINELITNVLKLDIINTEYENILEFNNISEYQFSLIKTKCKLFEGEEIDVYFKVVKKDKIKESIFCYWCLLYQEEIDKLKDKSQVKNNFLNKVLISEIEKERYKKSIFLEIDNNKTNIIKYGTEVHFIDFFKYIEKNQNKSEEIEKWLEYLDEDNEDLLLIGVKLTKGIGRSNINVL